MRKGVLALAWAVCLLWGLALPAQANSYTGGSGWRVVFTDEEVMRSTFKSAELSDQLARLEPGDDVVFTLTLTNENETAVDWYMTNKVLYSLEDRSANAATNGGAYSYVLTYRSAAGEEKILYSSDTVGGEHVSAAGEGLHEATNALEDFFYLDTHSTGQKGTITLKVALDGETQGNDYQDTLADLAMNFAVELKTPGASVPRVIVQTGDRSRLGLYYGVMAVSGMLFLLLAVDSIRHRRKEREERAS